MITGRLSRIGELFGILSRQLIGKSDSEMGKEGEEEGLAETREERRGGPLGAGGADWGGCLVHAGQPPIISHVLNIMPGPCCKGLWASEFEAADWRICSHFALQ